MAGGCEWASDGMNSACVASAFRLRYAIALYRSSDITYQAALMGKWADPELTCGFLAACLPVLPSFVRHVRSRRLFVRTMAMLGLRRAQLPSTPTWPSSGGSTRKKGGPVTDIEFDELVRRPDGASARSSLGDRMEGSWENLEDVQVPKSCIDGESTRGVFAAS